jgi:spore coat protein U-like protein
LVALKRASLGQGLVAVAAILLAVLLLSPSPAAAAITAGSCSVTTTGMTFSAYNSVTPAAVLSTGTFSVTCSGSGNQNLTLGLSAGGSGNCASRRMTSGANLLTYEIFSNAARTQPLCEPTRVTFAMNFPGGTPTRTVTVTMYGRVPSPQNPVFGTYSDTLTVTVRTTGGTSLATNNNVPINGSVAANCSVSATTLGFGTYIQTAASLSTAAVTVHCTSGAAYQVSLGGGNNLLAGTRRMAGPVAARLSYTLYSDPARTVAWGDGTALGAKRAGSGGGAPQALTVYGTIPAGQAPSPGAYADSVVVTVEY